MENYNGKCKACKWRKTQGSGKLCLHCKIGMYGQIRKQVNARARYH